MDDPPRPRYHDASRWRRRSAGPARRWPEPRTSRACPAACRRPAGAPAAHLHLPSPADGRGSAAAALVRGDLVVVPFGRRREVIGLVTAVEPLADDAREHGGRDPARRWSGCMPPEYRIGGDRLRLARWLADYYMLPLGEVVPLFHPPTPGTVARGAGRGARRLPRRRRRTGGPDRRPAARRWPPAGAHLDAGTFGTVLLHGVTGSGKTEVYLALIARGPGAGTQRHLPAAGDRADAPDPGPHPRPLRRPGGRHPQRAVGRPALPRARGRRPRRGAGGGRPALGPVRAGARAGRDRRGRGARDLLQAGREAALPRPARRPGAGARGAGGGAAGLGHPRPGERGQRPLRPLPPVQPAGPPRRRRPAAGGDRRHAGDLGAGRLLAGCSRTPWRPPWRRAGRASSTTTAAASPGPCSAATAARSGDVPPLRHRPDLPSAAAAPALPLLRARAAGARRLSGLRRAAPSCPAAAAPRRSSCTCRRRFPEARLLRLDHDTTRRRGSHRRILAAFAAGEADILVGTQMVAKGHHFPRRRPGGGAGGRRRPGPARLPRPPSARSSS